MVISITTTAEVTMPVTLNTLGVPFYCDKKDIMPTNGCTKLFVGINLVKKGISLP
jgi:hypothetical protein